ncbi:hypothetical protein [Mesorhizobium sp. KR2-14]|uniref:hypothetical protein n=1 Tax=Mesorhizobium sp. KR2-14 TaxID=3156610 RepID=UPI0032B50311
MSFLANFSRPEGDPKILHSGPSSMGPSDRLARALGWLSIGLGIVELLASSQLSRSLGMRGREGMVRACGAREIASGVLSLSINKEIGLWSRVIGDVIDIAALSGGLRSTNPRRENANLALAMVIGIAALDILAARSVTARHRRENGWRDYGDRSGFPKGLRTARSAAAR